MEILTDIKKKEKEEMEKQKGGKSIAPPSIPQRYSSLKSKVPKI